MTPDQIIANDKLATELNNFKDCYAGSTLYGDVNGEVTYERLLSFLIENPHFQEIADKIDRLHNLS